MTLNNMNRGELYESHFCADLTYIMLTAAMLIACSKNDSNMSPRGIFICEYSNYVVS